MYQYMHTYMYVHVVAFRVQFQARNYEWRANLWIWLLPYLTIYQLGNRLRSIAEHGGMTRSDDRRDTTHHVEQHPLARLLMTPYGVGYHLAHHVDSGVPFRNLPKLHRALADGGYLTGASTWPNYTSLWKALILR